MATTRAHLYEEPPEVQVELGRALRCTLAIVLAGGRGSRLGPLTEMQSKPAVPFAGKYRIVDFPLSNCINSGIRRVALLAQYKAHTLIQHVQRAWGFLRAELGEFVEVWPAQQQTSARSWYRGTADAVYQNLATMQGLAPEHVLILAGDHVYRQDYGVMLAEHVRGLAVDSIVSDGAVVSGGTVRRSLLSTDVRVNSNALVEDSVLLPGVVVGRRARVRRAVVDSGCTIPEGLVIGESPETDAARFFRTDEGVTLVTRPMLPI